MDMGVRCQGLTKRCLGLYQSVDGKQCKSMPGGPCIPDKRGVQIPLSSDEITPIYPELTLCQAPCLMRASVPQQSSQVSGISSVLLKEQVLGRFRDSAQVIAKHGRGRSRMQAQIFPESGFFYTRMNREHPHFSFYGEWMK